MTQRIWLGALILGILMSADPLHAESLRGITDDGRRVLLKSDGTWEFVQIPVGDPDTSAVLTVRDVVDYEKACRLDLHLKNNLTMRIGHLVPRFGIYNQDAVLFDSVSTSFSNIKPGREQYTSVQFNGIGCGQISRVKVYDAARCRMGDIDIWNEKEGQCLSRIYVTSSEKIDISK